MHLHNLASTIITQHTDYLCNLTEEVIIIHNVLKTLPHVINEEG